MSDKEMKHAVRVHINREPYESQNPTTGAALYLLAKIGAHSELFREVDGDCEDEVVPNSENIVHLKQDEHFYSERDFHIIVNAQEKIVLKKILSFDEIVHLAFDPTPVGPGIMFTITYRNGTHKNPRGTLLEGRSIKIKEGMVFNVTSTNKS